MKHDGFIPSDEADKLYSLPTLSGDSDTFLNGAGSFDHPHITYGTHNGGAPQSYTFSWGKGAYILPQITTDEYGHIVNIVWRRLSQSAAVATPTAAGLMSAEDKAKLDSL